MSLPAADDLFRPTAVPEEVPPKPTHEGQPAAEAAEQPGDAREVAEHGSAPRQQKQPSGRVRHDEKMTVYVTAEELLELEQTRLRLRSRGISVDRGRLVREAVAIALADFETDGEDSMLVRRLTDS